MCIHHFQYIHIEVKTYQYPSLSQLLCFQKEYTYKNNENLSKLCVKHVTGIGVSVPCLVTLISTIATVYCLLILAVEDLLGGKSLWCYLTYTYTFIHCRQAALLFNI